MQTDRGSNDEGDRKAGIELSFDEWYEAIAVNCFRYFGFKSLSEVDNMTMREYELLKKAYELKTIDKSYELHQQAYLNLAAQAKKKVGSRIEYKYQKFEDFFDYDKEIKKAEGQKVDSVISAVIEHLRKGG